MDSSQIFGGSEECNSCESGWTMYIGSTTYGENDGDGANDPSNDEVYKDGDDGGDKSDDSMTSDASSGPSHREPAWRIEEDGHGKVHKKNQEGKVKAKQYSQKKAINPGEKLMYGKRKEEKEVSVFTAKGANGENVKKNNHGGKRK